MKLFPSLRSLAAIAIGCLLAMSQAQAQASAAALGMRAAERLMLLGFKEGTRVRRWAVAQFCSTVPDVKSSTRYPSSSSSSSSSSK